MKPGLRDYLRAAFSARPIGMFVPPNWVGLAAFGLLGFLNPGFWLMGFGIELAYLGILASNERFQRNVAALQQWESRRQWQKRMEELVQQLGPEAQRRYRRLWSHAAVPSWNSSSVPPSCRPAWKPKGKAWGASCGCICACS